MSEANATESLRQAGKQNDRFVSAPYATVI